MNPFSIFSRRGTAAAAPVVNSARVGATTARTAVAPVTTADVTGSPSRTKTEASVTVKPPTGRIEHLHVPPAMIALLCKMANDPATIPAYLELTSGEVDRIKAAAVAEQEIDALRQIQVEYDRAQDFLRAHLAKDAKTLYLEQREQTAQAVIAGKGAEVSAASHWTLKDFEQDLHEKRKALKSRCRSIRASAQPIADALAARIGAAAGVLAAKLESVERKAAEQWGVDFAPSRQLMLLRYLANNYGTLADTGLGNPPRAALMFAGITV